MYTYSYTMGIQHYNGHSIDKIFYVVLFLFIYLFIFQNSTNENSPKFGIDL